MSCLSLQTLSERPFKLTLPSFQRLESVSKLIFSSQCFKRLTYKSAVKQLSKKLNTNKFRFIARYANMWGTKAPNVIRKVLRPKPTHKRVDGRKRGAVEPKQRQGKEGAQGECSKTTQNRYVPVSVTAENETIQDKNYVQADVNVTGIDIGILETENNLHDDAPHEIVVHTGGAENFMQVTDSDIVINYADEDSCGIHGGEVYDTCENDNFFVENETFNGDIKHALVENEEHIIDENVIAKNDFDRNGVVSFGALILRPDKFVCDLMKRSLWMKVDYVLRISETLKQFGVVMKGIEQDVEKVIKRNQLAVRSGILFQKCVLIFDRVSQLYLKPLDERSPPIASRTRRRKKGKNPLNRRTTYIISRLIGEIFGGGKIFFG
ncbi:UNVERIFIED_CONTAM: hypothetical protein Sradi_7203000 [Sesamum radiatum]|uniref:Uncharacterized protein n=1 Tax=Sesamum radiatum TaxID=300843 RepID=A0AAW2IPD9_SESRA